MASARTRYLPELFSSIVFSSLAVHLFFHRRAAAADRARLEARTSILDRLAARLRVGEPVPQQEIARLRKLAREAEHEHTRAQLDGAADAVGWRDVLLGRRATPAEAEVRDRWDSHDVEARAYLHFSPVSPYS